jgi:hypothetical protein
MAQPYSWAVIPVRGLSVETKKPDDLLPKFSVLSPSPSTCRAYYCIPYAAKAWACPYSWAYIKSGENLLERGRDLGLPEVCGAGLASPYFVWCRGK